MIRFKLRKKGVIPCDKAVVILSMTILLLVINRGEILLMVIFVHEFQSNYEHINRESNIY